MLKGSGDIGLKLPKARPGKRKGHQFVPLKKHPFCDGTSAECPQVQDANRYLQVLQTSTCSMEMRRDF